MKKWIALVWAVGLFLTCSLGVSAFTNSLTVNPMGLLFGVVNAQYEIAVDEKDSFTFNGSFLTFDMDDWELAGGGLEIGTRTYLRGNAPKGFFLGTSVGGAFVSTTYDDGWTRATGTGAMWTGTFNAGVKLISSGGFTGELAGGLSIAMGSVTAGSHTSKVRSSTPMVSLALGYSW